MDSRSSSKKENSLSSLTAHNISSFIALLGALFLSIETYLTAQGTSLCQTKACKIVSSYISVNESTLIAVGACYFWLLFIILFFSHRYPNHLRKFPELLLFPALAFDGALLGFQFFTIQEKCTLCIAVALFLIITSLVYSFSKKGMIGSLGILLIWLGGFFANYIVEMPEPTNAYNEMALIQFKDTSTSADTPSVFTLIMSLDCPHCIKVISYLEGYNTDGQIWRLASIDQNTESLQKIDRFLNKLPQTNNPFALLKTVKKDKETTTFFSGRNLAKKTKKTLSFLRNLGVNTIPVLVVKNPHHKIEIFTGSERIIEYLETVRQKE